ncbi:DNA polymerase III subunit beta [Candidatus Uhrbacteria bacterium]|nr:DNA polymerase III subunit beta [Candidatus Uhrbacteria bacterium]
MQENLYRGLQIASHICGRERGLPILSTLLIKTENGLIHLNATNLEIGIHCTIRGRVEEEGMVAIDAKVFTDYVGFLPKEKIEISVSPEHQISVTCQGYATRIRGISPDDFPILPSFEKKAVFVCHAEDMRKGLQSTSIAVTINESRPEISGLLFQYSKEKQILSLVGTDAYRLAEKHIPIKIQEGEAEDFSCILPLRTVQELLRILGGESQQHDVVICVNENQILFLYENIELISKIIQGQYPDYTQIIPAQFQTKVLLDTSECIKAVKASSLFSRSELQDIHLSIQPKIEGRGDVHIRAENTTIGRHEVVLEGEVKGNENTVALNYRYMLDGLMQSSEEKISIEIIDSNNPCIIRPVGRDDYMYLIMPIRE